MKPDEQCRFGNLDLSDQAQIDAYETALYRAFSRTYIKTLDRIWDIDNQARRIVTRVPYSGQQIVCAWRASRVVAAVAINTAMDATLQLELMDFRIERDGPRACEALHIFNLLDPLHGLSLMRELSGHLMENLHRQGFGRIYGTTSQKRLRAYQFMGFEVIDQHLFFGEMKYLMVQRIGTASTTLQAVLPPQAHEVVQA